MEFQLGTSKADRLEMKREKTKVVLMAMLMGSTMVEQLDACWGSRLDDRTDRTMGIQRAEWLEN